MSGERVEWVVRCKMTEAKRCGPSTFEDEQTARAMMDISDNQLASGKWHTHLCGPHRLFKRTITEEPINAE